MPAIEIRTSRPEFADVMGQMRAWLDHNGDPEMRFGTVTTATGEIVIHAEFRSEQAAAAFSLHFGLSLPQAA